MRSGRGAPSPPVPTRAGLVLLALSVPALAAGCWIGDNALILVGSLAAGCIATAFLLCRSNLRGISVTRRVPDALDAGTAFHEEMVVRNTKRVFPCALVLVRDRIEGRGVPRLPSFFFAAVPYLPPGGQARLRPEGLFFKRGRKRFLQVEISSTFPLGLFRARRRLPLEESIVVFPRRSPVPTRLFPDPAPHPVYTVPVRTRAGNEEFAGLREFRPGDNPKWIHWKSTGRPDDRLLVREMGRPAVRQVEIVLDRALTPGGVHGAAHFERAVRAGASLAHDLVARGYGIDFRIRGAAGAGDSLHEVRPGDGSLPALLETLALLAPIRGVPPGRRPAAPSPPLEGKPRMTIRAGDLRTSRSFEEVLRWE